MLIMGTVLSMTYPTKKIGEVCEINMGQSPSSSTYNQEKIGLPFYQGKKDYGEKYPTPRVWCSNPIKIVEAGDILISVRAPVGALNIAKEKSCIGRGLAGLRVKKELDQDFLFHYLQLKEKDISALGTGSTFTAISKKHLENLEIPLPAIEIQKKIVKKIEELFAKIDQAQSIRHLAVQDVDNLIPSALAEFLLKAKSEGWPEKQLGELCDINPRNDIKGLSNNTLVSFIPMKYVDDIHGRVNQMDVRKLNEVKKGYTGFKSNDVIFAKITPCMENGKAAIVRGLKNGIGFGSTEFHILRPKGDILPELIYYYIRRKSFRDEAEKRMTGSAGQKRVPKEFLERSIIPVPPLAEQRKIVARLDAITQKVRELQTLQAETAADMKALKQSILHKAFQGELIH